MTEFPQNTIGEIIDSERAMILTAPQRYGKYYETALEASLLMSGFLEFMGSDRWIFGNFLSTVKKHHTLALFSTVRLQKVQAMMNLRQTLEAGACAAFAIANPDDAHFVDTDTFGILDPSQKLARSRYNWLHQNYPVGSAAIKEIKDEINKNSAHANLISTHRTCRTDNSAGQLVAPFFDIEDEYYVKIDLWIIAHVAHTLLQLFYGINDGRGVIKFRNNFVSSIQILGVKNEALRKEMMATDRCQRAMAKENARKGG